MTDRGTRSTHRVRPDALLEKTNQAAYWQGFLMADGSVSEKTNEIRLKLGIKDADHLRKFCEYLGLPVTRCHKYEKEALVSFSDKNIKEELSKIGIGPKKTFTAEIKNDWLNSNRFFWSGFIDGDGTLHHGSPNKDQIRYSIGAVSGGEKILEQFQNFVFKETGILLKILKQQKVNLNYTVNTGGKKAVRIMQLLYKNNPYALDRKYKIAVKAAKRYSSKLNGSPINWQTASSEPYIWLEPRSINKKFRVKGNNDFDIGYFSTIEIARSARDLFFDLIDKDYSQLKAKNEVHKTYKEYFPKSYNKGTYKIRYDAKRKKFIVRVYYQSNIPGIKGKDIYILETPHKDLAMAIQEIANRLRDANYIYKGRRDRIENGTFIYDHALPYNWVQILKRSGLSKYKILKLEQLIEPFE